VAGRYQIDPMPRNAGVGEPQPGRRSSGAGGQISNVIANVFRGPFFQVAVGVAVGCVILGSLVAVAMRDSDVGVDTVTRHAALLLVYGATMMA
jgi:hypothetical protein